jgi:DNA-binding CsgD family transcriptional regulator
MHLMEFKNEALIEREIEIAGYLLQNFSAKQIIEKTSLSKKHLDAHIANMKRKLKVNDNTALMKLIKERCITT